MLPGWPPQKVKLMNSHRPKKKSEPTGRRPTLSSRLLSKSLRVVELGQAENVSAAEHFVGELQRRNACLGIQIVAEAVDQRQADQAALNAGQLGHIELGLKEQL